MNKMISDNKTPVSDNERNETCGIWNERTKTWIRPSGTVKQGRRPMFQPHAAPAQAQHSSLPWKIEDSDYLNEGGHFPISSSDDHFVCEPRVLYDGSGRRAQFPDGVILSKETAYANATLIVHACNNAQRLADALAWVIGDDTSNEPSIVAAREALAEWSKSI